MVVAFLIVYGIIAIIGGSLAVMKWENNLIGGSVSEQTDIQIIHINTNMSNSINASTEVVFDYTGKVLLV